MADRSGNRKKREQLFKRRIPSLGYYFIVTDTEETEQNYILGLRDSIPTELRDNLVIKVCKAKTVELVREALSMASLQPQYGEPWIVFDRDQVKDFDQIVSNAQVNDINVGWSNPCIEIWFSAYFGTMPAYTDSVSCCNGFGQIYRQVTKQKYRKSEPAIYSKLSHFGDEKRAIEIAKQKYAEQEKNCSKNPSQMYPCTTLHILIEEIQDKVKKHPSI